MFESFFPKPKLFLVSLLTWTGVMMAIYYTVGQSIGEFFGFTFTDEGAVIPNLTWPPFISNTVILTSLSITKD